MDSPSGYKLLNIAIAAFILLFPHFVPLPFYSYAGVCLLVIVFGLRRQGESLASLGWPKRGLTVRVAAVGWGSALAWAAFMRWMYVPVISYCFEVPDYTEYDFIRGNFPNLLITTLAAWLVGGFYEEVAFRGFLLSRFARYGLPFWAGAAATSVLFGLYHWQQGIFGMVAATLGGLYWALLYKFGGRNLWYPILSHAAFDTITLTLIYLGWFGQAR